MAPRGRQLCAPAASQSSVRGPALRTRSSSPARRRGQPPAPASRRRPRGLLAATTATADRRRDRRRLVDGPATTRPTRRRPTTLCPTTTAMTISTPGRRGPLRLRLDLRRRTSLTAARTATTPTGRTSTLAVAIDMRSGSAGLIGPVNAAAVPKRAAADRPRSVRGHRGTSLGDILLGDSGPTSCWEGPVTTPTARRRRRLDPRQLGQTPIRLIDCGEGFDTAQIDFPTTPRPRLRDAAPVANCEESRNAPPNSFRPPKTPPIRTRAAGGATLPSAPAVSTRRPADRIAPEPRSSTHPARSCLHRAEAAPGRLRLRLQRARATFRCKLDGARSTAAARPAPTRFRRRGTPSASVAIDGAGNRDRLPDRCSVFPRPPSLSGRWSRSRRRRGRTRPAPRPRPARQGDRQRRSWAIRSAAATLKISAGSLLSSSTRTSPR
jgi:hypothetical protein